VGFRGDGAQAHRRRAEALEDFADWFDLFDTPIYLPWKLFEWWFFFGAVAMVTRNDACIVT